MARSSSRRSPRGGSRSSSRTRGTEAKTRTSRYRGEEGRRRALEEQERIRERREQQRLQSNMPFRFWMPPNSERRIIVLDEEPDFYRYEHALLNERGRGAQKYTYTDCMEDTGNCPICDASPDNRPYYALYLSVIDLEPFTTRDGEEVQWSRKLFVVKSGMQRQWARQFERGGSLRGKVFDVFRDNDKSPVTGNQIEVADEEPYTEEELGEFVREWTDRDNKVHEDDCSVPFDYEEIMPEMSFDELAAVVGGAKASPGSRRHEEEEFADEEEETDAEADDDEDWDGPEDEKEEPAPRGRSRSAGRSVERGRRARRGEETEAREEEEEEENERPRRGARSSRGARSRSRVRR